MVFNNGLLIHFSRITDNSQFIISTAATANRQVILPIAYSNTKYIVIGSTSFSGIMFLIYSPSNTKKTTEFYIALGNATGRADANAFYNNVSWITIGY